MILKKRFSFNLIEHVLSKIKDGKIRIGTCNIISEK